MKNQKGLAPVLIVIIVAIIIAGGALFLFGKGQTVQPVQQPAQTTSEDSSSTTPTSFENILTPLRDKLNLKTSQLKDDEKEWVVNYQKLVPLTGQSFSNGDGFIEDKAVAEKIGESVDAYFTSLGFLKNTINSSNTLDVDVGDRFLSGGYTKNDIKCLFTLYVAGSPSGFYFCGKIDDAREKFREEFTADFDTGEKSALGPDTVSVIDVKKVIGNFATGTDNEYTKGIYLPSGAMWIAVKENGRWKIISEGQQYPPCSVIDQYKVPVEIYVNCLNPGTDASSRFKDK